MMPAHSYPCQRLNAHAVGRKQTPDQQILIMRERRAGKTKVRGRRTSNLVAHSSIAVLGHNVKKIFAFAIFLTTRRKRTDTDISTMQMLADTDTHTCQASSMPSCTAQRPRQSFGAQFASSQLLELMLLAEYLAKAGRACTGVRGSEPS